MTCPPNGRIVSGANCVGDDLNCAAQVNIAACDGSILSVETSCSCSSGKWQCPPLVEPNCPEPVSEAGGTSGIIDTIPAETSASAGDTSGVPGTTAVLPTGSGGAPSGGTTTAPAAGGARTPLSRAPQTGPNDGSCPFIFAWNGSGFEYQTDIEGEVVGLPPVAAVNNGMALFHSSHVKMSTAVFDPVQGLELRLREVIAEVSYFDQARLLLIDHPAGTEVWSNSGASTYEWGYVDPFKIYTTQDPTLPIAAVDEAGNDILDYLTKLDDRPAPVQIDSDHYYTIDFGPISDYAHAKLLLEGWAIYKIPSTENIRPFIEVEAEPDVWVKIVEFGVPAGDLKPILVDLANLLPIGTQRMRLHMGIWSPGRWVLDRIRLDQSPPADIRLQYVDAVAAELFHRGRATTRYSSLTNRIASVDDEAEDFPSNYGYGSYTRYGDVLPLMTEADDKYVIMRHGDQITVRYPGVPAPQPGYDRTAMLEADVFYKVNLNPAELMWAEPMPFHGMSRYPYAAPEAYPSDLDHQSYVQLYNTRRFEPDPTPQ